GRGWFGGQGFRAFVSTYYLFVQGRAFVAFLRRVSPLNAKQTEALLAEFRSVTNSLFRGNLVVALVQGTSAGIGYLIFGVGHVVLLATITMFASFVPLVGTSLVWGPIVIWLALTHHLA